MIKYRIAFFLKYFLAFLFAGTVFSAENARDRFIPERQEKGSNCPYEILDSFKGVLNSAGTVISNAASLNTSTDSRCGAVSVNDAQNLDLCLRTNTNGPIPSAAVAEAVFEDMFFQELASNSHRQANCRLQMISEIHAQDGKFGQLAAKAAQEFSKIREDVLDLINYKKKLESDLEEFRNDYRYAGRDMTGVRNSGIKAREADIAKADQIISQAIMKIPMGYEPEIGMAIREMAVSGRWDVARFKNALAASATKYVKSSEYYQGKEIPTSNGRVRYCLGVEYKETAGQSGQLHELAQKIPNEGLRGKLMCRLDAKYIDGPKKLAQAEMVVMVAGMAVGGGLAYKGIRVAGGAFSAIGFAGSAAEAVGVVAALDAARKACFSKTYVLSGQQTCDSNAEFQHTLQEPDLATCALNGAVAALPLPLHLRQYLAARRAARAANRSDAVVLAARQGELPALPRAAAAGDEAGNEVAEIVVTAPTTSKAARERRIEILTRNTLEDKRKLDQLLSSVYTGPGDPTTLYNSYLRSGKSVDDFLNNPNVTLSAAEKKQFRELNERIQRDRATLNRIHVSDDLDRLKTEGNAEIEDINCNMLNKLNSEPAFFTGSACSKVTIKKSVQYCSCGAQGRIGNWLGPCSESIASYFSIDELGDRNALPSQSVRNLRECKRVILEEGAVVFHGGLNPTMSGFGGGAQVFLPKGKYINTPEMTENYANVGAVAEEFPDVSKIRVVAFAPVHESREISAIYNAGRECLQSSVGPLACRNRAQDYVVQFNRAVASGKVKVTAEERAQFERWIEWVKGCKNLNPNTGDLDEGVADLANCRK